MSNIYLACPYSSKSEALRKARFERANREAARLMVSGHIVFSPISHSVVIAENITTPNDHEFWMKQCLPFLDWCDELYVIKMGGWNTSLGVTAEIERARLLGKPVRYI